ncbi:MAG: hypothetical protein LBI64_06135 [Coriobacteriales bacterium]|nr:hypothetical protein [Coriobacteriales bacterium]
MVDNTGDGAGGGTAEGGRHIDLEADYDPLAGDAGDALDGEEENVAFIGFIEHQVEEALDPPSESIRPPEERIADLLASLPNQKDLLLKIIGYCREARSPGEVDAFTVELQKTNKSVYTPVILRKLLEDSGALVYEEPELSASAPGAAEARQANTPVPEMESDVAAAMSAGLPDDEQLYLVVEKRVEGTWLSTAAALGILDALDPITDLRALLAAEEKYSEIYLRILRYCAEEPRTKPELNALVDDDPLLQSPRRYSGAFIERLNENGALEWKPRWATTAAGLKLLREHDRAEGS